MNFKFATVGLGTAGLGTLAVALVGLSLTGSPADAQQRRYGPNSQPDVSYQQGPRTRIFVSRRNWLDLGTEVRPGERKYTDYALPPGNSVVDQLTGRPFARQPFNDVWDLPGYSKNGYGY
jgi:hypothetical protein